MPLPSVPHMGQGWVSPTNHDHWLLSLGPCTWVGSAGQAIDGIYAERGMEAPGRPVLDCAGPAAASGKWAGGSAE